MQLTEPAITLVDDKPLRNDVVLDGDLPVSSGGAGETDMAAAGGNGSFFD